MFASCSNLAVDGMNIVVPPEENLLKGNQLNATFSNPNELKALLTVPNGRLIDNGEIAVQVKSEFNGHLAKVSEKKKKSPLLSDCTSVQQPRWPYQQSIDHSRPNQRAYLQYLAC